MALDISLKRFANEDQWASVLAVETHGTIRKAARALGLNHTTVMRHLKKVMRNAAQQGYAPNFGLTHELPAGLKLKGTSIRYSGNGAIEQYWNKSGLAGREPEDAVKLADPKKITKLSTNYDAQGKITQQWVSEQPEAAAKEKLWEAFGRELAVKLPRVKPSKGPKNSSKDLLAVYPVGDHHMGMLSWDKETGHDYDLKIGEKLLVDATAHLVSLAPACDKALVAFLGDFLHYDSFKPVTPTSGNVLDADSRFPKMVQASVRTMRRTIDLTLLKHDNVTVIIEIGNHDLSSSIFLMVALAAIYENEPRVTIDMSPMHYHYYRFGNCLLGTHHGHGAKPEKLPLIMATDRRKDWGDTEHRLWMTGHIHHDSRREYTGCMVESFRVLPPEDAYAHQKGYRSGRDMKGLIFHREFGEVARNTVNPAMF